MNSVTHADQNTSSFMDSYRKFMERNGDPRTENWLFMSGPGPILTLLATYLYFCKVIGPRYMKDKKPYSLKNTIFVYNIVQILLSVHLIYEGLVSGWWNDYSFSCQPIDYSNNPKAIRMASVVWLYFMAKIVELLDTVFFVLRKKYNQVTTLHLYHHTLMPLSGWIATKFLPGGHGTLLGVINSFVHVIMYAYYLIAGLGPEYQKYLWWKKHLTTMQLVQFVMVFVHNFSVLFRNCNYPKGINMLLCTNACVFMYMFGNFYYRSYILSKPKKTDDKNAGNSQAILANGKAKDC